MAKVESGLMLGEDSMPHDEHETVLTPPEIIAVVDLGKGNKGSINAADLTGEARDALVSDLAKPEYRRRPTKRFRCVDGRLPEDGLQHEDNQEADPQGAGGEGVFEPMIDYMTEDDSVAPLSQKVEEKVQFAVEERGRRVVIHGDTHKGKGGCGANVRKHEALRANLENIDVVAPRAWFIVQQAGIDHLLTEEDVLRTVERGAAAAEKDELWDITPQEHVDIAVAAGAEYEELIEDHLEKAALVDVSEYAFDEEAFIADHRLENGLSLEAFVASVGVYKKQAFEDARYLGETEEYAAKRVLGFILFNIGVPKELTAEEQGNGEALPVVIIK